MEKEIIELTPEEYTSCFSEIELAEFSEDKEYELITTAKQTDHRYGDFQYSKEQLETMAKNFNDNVVGTEIPVDLNHDPEHIAYAWIKPWSMVVKESTQLKGEYSLYAQLYRFTPEGEDMIKTWKLRYFSLQIQHEFSKFVDNVKKVYKLVIRAMALTNMPVIKDMAPTLSEEKNKPLFFNHSHMEKTVEQMLADTELALTEKDVLLSEKEAEIKSLAEKVEAIEREKHEKFLTDEVEKLCLSDDKTIAFKGGEKEKVLDFVKTLSEEQAKAYFALHANILASVTLGEEGEGGEGEAVVEESEAEAEVAKLSEALAKKEGISYRKAMERVLAENPALSEKIAV